MNSESSLQANNFVHVDDLRQIPNKGTQTTDDTAEELKINFGFVRFQTVGLLVRILVTLRISNSSTGHFWILPGHFGGKISTLNQPGSWTQDFFLISCACPLWSSIFRTKTITNCGSRGWHPLETDLFGVVVDVKNCQSLMLRFLSVFHVECETPNCSMFHIMIVFIPSERSCRRRAKTFADCSFDFDRDREASQVLPLFILQFHFHGHLDLEKKTIVSVWSCSPPANWPYKQYMCVTFVTFVHKIDREVLDFIFQWKSESAPEVCRAQAGAKPPSFKGPRVMRNPGSYLHQTKSCLPWDTPSELAECWRRCWCPQASQDIARRTCTHSTGAAGRAAGCRSRSRAPPPSRAAWPHLRLKVFNCILWGEFRAKNVHKFTRCTQSPAGIPAAAGHMTLLWLSIEVTLHNHTTTKRFYFRKLQQWLFWGPKYFWSVQIIWDHMWKNYICKHDSALTGGEVDLEGSIVSGGQEAARAATRSHVNAVDVAARRTCMQNTGNCIDISGSTPLCPAQPDIDIRQCFLSATGRAYGRAGLWSILVCVVTAVSGLYTEVRYPPIPRLWLDVRFTKLNCRSVFLPLEICSWLVNFDEWHTSHSRDNQIWPKGGLHQQGHHKSFDEWRTMWSSSTCTGWDTTATRTIINIDYEPVVTEVFEEQSGEVHWDQTYLSITVQYESHFCLSVKSGFVRLLDRQGNSARCAFQTIRV